MKRETAAGTATALWCISWGQAESCQDADIPALKFTCCFSREAGMTTSFPIGPSYFEHRHICNLRWKKLDFSGKEHFRGILNQPPPSADKAAETQSFIMGRSRHGWSAHHQRSQHPLCQPWPLGLQVQGRNRDYKSPSLITCRKFYQINEIILSTVSGTIWAFNKLSLLLGFFMMLPFPLFSSPCSWEERTSKKNIFGSPAVSCAWIFKCSFI